VKAARPAFYALEMGGWRDFVTLLHPPYTVMHLSFVCLGAGLAADIHYDRLIATLFAFFLAVGVAAHFLDELQGRPLHTTVSSSVLKIGATVSLSGAAALGVLGAIEVSPALLLFVAIGTTAVLAYNLELFDGLVHGDVQFALLWGAFPFLTANWIMTESFDASSILGAAACFTVAMAQRSLSNPVRTLRRRVKSVEGEITYNDGTTAGLDRADLIAAAERGLRYLSLSMPLLAGALIALRLLQ
jgi:hypothetical protein